MGYPSAYYEQAEQIMEQRRYENRREESRREKEVSDKIPEAGRLITGLAGTIDKLAKIILAHDDNAAQQIEKLKDENLADQDRLSALLKENGYPTDYLDKIYTCEKCRDSGVLEDRRCECFHTVLRQIAAKELSKSIPIGLASFESFDIKYYSDVKSPALGGLSPRDIMEQNFRYCEKYAANFHIPCESIFMSGGTGLGKTHLSLAIAKSVIDKEYSVVYGSAPDLLGKIESAHFDRNDDENSEAMLTVKECDLLVLDDLGAEFPSQFYSACIYSIINTRLNYGRPTIVNSNLTYEELKSRYTDRIASRLISMKNLKFAGSDIRIAKR